MTDVQTRSQVRFTVYQPGIAPQQLAIPGDMITLGRASDCTIPIKDRFLSRRHAEIVRDRGQWYVRDCGSVNGTLVNGVKIADPVPLRPGDRIALGDSEVVFHADDQPSQLIAIDSDSHATNLAIKIDSEERGTERTKVLNSLAIEFLADRPMSDLFEFILDRVVGLLHPSRAAMALFGPDRATFDMVKLRRQDQTDSTDLLSSRTLLKEVVDGRQVVSFFDSSADEKLARAQSIVAQDIRSAICAPLLVGDAVLGVLYLDYKATRGAVSENDVRLVGQIARFAAVTLERTRLREEAFAKAKIDEELRTAYAIQKRLLPSSLPVVDGYTFAASNRPAKSVSGDYYDMVVRPNGRIYFVIADVSGKGITAAIVMSSVATAFNIFTRTDPTPADLVRELNATLAPKTAPTKFVTLVAGVLDPATGKVDYANAGHVPPLVLSPGGVETLKTTDLVVGLFPQAQYRNQTIQLEPGDAMVLFTDGVTEAENEKEEQLGLTTVADMLVKLHRAPAARILSAIEEHVHAHIGETPPGDDVTMLALTRSA